MGEGERNGGGRDEGRVMYGVGGWGEGMGREG